MSSIAVSFIVFGFVFGGVVLSMLFRGSLPHDHLGADTQNIVNLGMGLVATMSALVLGLLISSAHSFYTAQNAEVTGMSARITVLDRLLAHYGPETKEVRDLLRGAVVESLDRIWPQDGKQPSRLGPQSTSADAFLYKIQALSPKDDRQRALQAQALSMTIGLDQTRWLMYEQGASSVSKFVLVILVFWLTAIFMSFGLFAPRNATVAVALFVAGLSVSGAIFLILEMYAPYSGLIKISSAPLRAALTQLGQ